MQKIVAEQQVVMKNPGLSGIVCDFPSLLSSIINKFTQERLKAKMYKNRCIIIQKKVNMKN